MNNKQLFGVLTSMFSILASCPLLLAAPTLVVKEYDVGKTPSTTVELHQPEFAEWLNKTDYTQWPRAFSNGPDSVIFYDFPMVTKLVYNGGAQYFTNLVPGVTYDWKIGGKSGKFTAAAEPPRTLAAPVYGTREAEFVRAFRDLGGWRLEGAAGKRLNYGKIFRSANFDRYYQNSDHRENNPVFTTLGIKTEIDLRQPNESWIDSLTDIESFSIDTEQYCFTNANADSAYYGKTGRDYPFTVPPSMLPADVDGHRYFQVRYQPMLIKDDYHSTTCQVRRAFKILCQPDYYPIVFHCAGGRDRTGQLAFLIEALCGVNLDDIYRDHLAVIFAGKGNFRGADEYITDLYTDLQSSWHGYKMDKYGDSLTGHVRAYLERYGVTTEEMSRLTTAMTGETIDEVLDRVNAHEASNHYRTITYSSNGKVLMKYRVGDDILYRKPDDPVSEGLYFAGWTAEDANGVRTASWSATPPADHADCISISEIMAKNESVISTKNGFDGIDWVELHNSGDAEIDVTGWCLGNDPTKSPGKWPKIQGSCVIPAGGYRIVWCDGDGICTDWADDEAHVDCNLSSDAGKHVVFIATDASADAILERRELPKSFDDVSVAFAPPPVTLVGEKASAQYRIGDSGSWKNVNGALGMSEVKSCLQTVTYKLASNVNSVEAARKAMSNSSKWKSGCLPKTNFVEKIAFRGEGTSLGAFATSQYADFPGYNGWRIVMSVTGKIVVPSDGEWTFAVGSDDGFEAKISQSSTVKASWKVADVNEWGEHSYNSRGTGVPDMGMKTVSLTAGEYDFELVYYDVEGGCILDCSAAKGSYSAFDSSKFKLLGSETCEIKFARSFAGEIAKDVRSEMLGRSDTLNWKADFSVGSEAMKQACKLRIRYADGFTAKINGSEFASAAANGARRAEEALKWVDFPIPADKVNVGNNTLTVDATNNAEGDPEFFLQVAVVSAEGEPTWVYYPTPTPGAVNSADVRTGPTPEVAFSEPHGYKSAAFDLTLACPEESSRNIYYTLDGSKPVPGAAKTRLYERPISVSKTTVVRAAAADETSILQTDTSATYLFLDDILQQGSTPPEGFPASGEVNGQVMRYGLNSSVTGNETLRTKLRKGFLEGIRTVSLVMDPKDLFDREKGIYVNADQSGREWERMTMLEQIYPVDTKDEFSVACGVRIRGAFSRHPNYPKRGFHMIFRDEYGADRLEHPLFGAAGAQSFKKIDFRCDQNNAWVNGKRNGGEETVDYGAAETLINEVFARDAQRDLGQPHNRSNYYHLFINGIYWGVYQTEERVDQNYAADYLGGDKENYDVIRTSNAYSGGEITYTTGATDGEELAWQRLHELTVQGYATGDNYNLVRGLDATGKRDPALPVYLDVENLICYMLTSQWGADGDTPASIRDHANNIIAYRNRVTGDAKSEGFKWNRHDAEHSMAKRAQTDGYDANETYLLFGSFASSYGNSLANFNPQALHIELMKNAEYKRTFQDLVQKHLLAPGGVMTVEANEARYRVRMAEIDDAVMGELARWGGAYTRSDWETACGNDLEFIEKRPDYLFANYRKLGWFPETEAPAILNAADDRPLVDGERVAAGFQVRMTKTAGTIYYTTDGSDPANLDGTPGSTAVQYQSRFAVPNTGLRIKARVKNGSEWSALSEVRLRGEIREDTVFTGVYKDLVVLDENGRYICSNANFKAGILITDGVVAKLDAAVGTENEISLLDAPNAEVRFGGDGEVKFEGEDTLMTVSNLVVKSGVLSVKSTGVSATKTPVVNVLGFVEQSGGRIEMDLDVETEYQIYGIYVANKNPKGKTVYVDFGGGEFSATVGGTRSSAVYINKGSVDTTFDDGEEITAVLKGVEPRFVSASGDLEFGNCSAAVTMGTGYSTISGARVFKSDKDISVTGADAHFDVNVPGPGAEIFSSAGTITIDAGTFELKASDDCFSATDRIVVNGGRIYAVSLADDVFDSNGDMEINDGTVLAYTTAEGHEAFDVDPEETAESEKYPLHQLRVNGGVIFATGGTGGSWPEGWGNGTTIGYVRDNRNLNEVYLKLYSTYGTRYVAKVLDKPRDAQMVFAVCPGYSDSLNPKYEIVAAAPETGDQHFHDLYIYESAPSDQDQLRFYEIYGSTATNETETTGDVGEYIVLTNVSDKTVSLAGLRVNVEKASDWETTGESASKCRFMLTEGTVGAYGSVRFDQADYWGESGQKIANGAVHVELVNCVNETVQSGEASFDNTKYPGVDGLGAALRARAFTPEMEDDVEHWCSSVAGPVDPVDPVDPVVPGSQIATGGDRIYTNTVGGVTYCIHEFTSTGAAKKFENVSGKALNVEYLVVGGGGAGGDGHPLPSDYIYGGGGGGGGVYSDAATLEVDESWTVAVGRGGRLSSNGVDRIGYADPRVVAGSSSIRGVSVNVEAPGGGAGGSCSGKPELAAQNGAAGGGAGTYSKSIPAGKGTFQSYLNGTTYGSYAGGVAGTYGGGGGGAGGNASGDSEKGGAGLTSSFTGEDVVYGAGGDGGKDGGVSGKSGTNGTGCGGGGGIGGTPNAGEGGDGIVIIRYKLDGSVTPTTEWDIPGKSGGINGKNGTGGVKYIDFTSVSLDGGKLTVAFEAGKVNANGQTFGLVCKKNLTDKDTFKISVKLTDDGTGAATLGVLEGATNEPQLFILGIGPAE